LGGGGIWATSPQNPIPAVAHRSQKTEGEERGEGAGGARSAWGRGKDEGGGDAP
jgi:hypothetical protein